MQGKNPETSVFETLQWRRGWDPQNEMATIGHIQEFDPEKEKVSAYLERVQMFLIANSIEAEKKVPVLLSGGRRTRCSAVY